MGILQQRRAQTVGRRTEDTSLLPSANHFKTASGGEILKQAAALGLRRVAGNIFLSPSSRDLWKGRNGKIVRLTQVEVDFGEKMPGAPADDPGAYLQDALDDLTF
jgi:hypothetical protein